MMYICIQLDGQASQIPDSVMLSIAAYDPSNKGSNTRVFTITLNWVNLG